MQQDCDVFYTVFGNWVSAVAATSPAAARACSCDTAFLTIALSCNLAH